MTFIVYFWAFMLAIGAVCAGAWLIEKAERMPGVFWRSFFITTSAIWQVLGLIAFAGLCGMAATRMFAA